MAKALQCPTCGHRQRLDEVADVATFRCSQCDRLLKVPSSVRPAAAAPAPPRDADPVGATRGRTAPGTSGAGRGPGAGAATAPRPAAPARPPGPPPAQGRPADAPAAAATAVHPGPSEPQRRSEPVVVRGDLGVHWALRILVWAASLGIGFVVVLMVARSAGYVTFDAATDVIADEGITRYRVPATFALGWALVSALLAHLGIEGLARWARARHVAAAER
jgi:hypothetical protein